MKILIRVLAGEQGRPTPLTTSKLMPPASPGGSQDELKNGLGLSQIIHPENWRSDSRRCCVIGYHRHFYGKYTDKSLTP